ncbi:hypothetical protein P4637_03140 [Halalkalibacterium halodurans]|uniref:hypothetical protein n=1 Tax=Halalkalibacterium halodurans TaxID=86665 RepID=UPI002E1A47A6|nr:hypothetical protein [Halalkalibacterium halodurans]MED4105495.1 hypothetical protein [Halalkalibacterium halodurans]MED4109299.1 hypothetical protein [Halalkalibacterium halodurans]MED4149687.1 hypothetical protein [Halalkalibacterium halodurans]
MEMKKNLLDALELIKTAIEEKNVTDFYDLDQDVKTKCFDQVNSLIDMEFLGGCGEHYIYNYKGILRVRFQDGHDPLRDEDGYYIPFRERVDKFFVDFDNGRGEFITFENDCNRSMARLAAINVALNLLKD